tara:strand:- start:4396 stop:4887 length:492 start_codon:yes stop_codon:yes gene_type:complete
MSKRIIIGATTIILLLFAAFWLFWPSEEDRIREQFDELSQLVSKTEDSSPLTDALILDDFVNLFCDKVTLKTGNRKRLSGGYVNHELGQLCLRLRVSAKTIDLRFENLEFLEVNLDDAKVTVRVKAFVSEKRGKKHSENFQAEVFIRKREGDWRFASFTYSGR